MPLKAGLRQPWESQGGISAGFMDPAQVQAMVGTPASSLLSESSQQYMAQREQPQQSSGRILFDPDRRQFLINNVTVDADDIEYLQRAQEFLSEPVNTDVPEGNWREAGTSEIQSSIDALMDYRVSDRLRAGAQGVGQSLLSGTGRLAHMAGAEELGDSLIRAGERVGMDEKEQGRAAAVFEANSLWRNMLGAAQEGSISFGTSIGAGVAGGKLGAMVGGPSGALIGAGIGAFASIFPMMVESAYQAATQYQGEDYANSQAGRQAIATTALGTTIVQTLAPSMVASRVLNMLAKNAAHKTVMRQLGSGRLGAAGTIGMTEAAAEASAYLIDQIVFDPEIRGMLGRDEVGALWNHMVERHGEQTIINAFAGFALGGTAGLVVGNPGPREASKAKDGEPTDVNKIAGEQARKNEALEQAPSSPVYPAAVPVGDPSKPLFGNQVRQGVLPFSEFSEQEVNDLSRVTGERGENLADPVSSPIGQERIDATDSTGQGTLPFAIPESHRLAGPPDDSGPAAPGGMPPPDMGQQNLFDFGVPIPPGAVDQTQQAEPVVEPEPEQPPPMASNQRGTTMGAPFTSAKRAEMSLERIAKDLSVSRSDLEVVPVEGGFAAQVKAGAVETPVEGGKRRPPRLYRGFGMREFLRRAQGVVAKIPGMFFTENLEYASGRYTQSVEGRGAVLSTEMVPENYLDIDKLSAKTKAGEAARKKMRGQLEKFVAESEQYTSEDIPDSYIYEVLENGENDFAQPNQLDIDFLRSLGHEAVYFSVEGPVGSGIETQVDTWFLFDNPFNDYVGEMRAALGLEPGERSVAENRKQTGYETKPQDAPTPQAEDATEIQEALAGQAVDPVDAWADVALPIAWDDLSTGQQNSWRDLVAKEPENSVENPVIEVIVERVLDEASADVLAVVNSVDGVNFPSNIAFLLPIAFDPAYNQAGKSKAARAWARSLIEEVMGSNESQIHAGFVLYLREFSETHVDKFNGLVGDPIFDKILKSRDARSSVQNYYNRNLDSDGKLPSAEALKAAAKAAKAEDRARLKQEAERQKLEQQQEEKQNAASIIAKEIYDWRLEKTKPSAALIKQRKARLRKLWENTIAAGQQDAMYNETTPISAFFEDGKPIFHPHTGKPHNAIVDAAEAKALADLQRAESKRAAEELKEKLELLSEGNADDGFGGAVDDALSGNDRTPRGVVPKGGYLRADGTPITKPLDRGKARLLVKAFVAKLATKVKVGVYTNAADFAKRNPEAYAKAKEARPDLGTRPAAALYYGDGNIAVFTDSILTTEQLRVTLAHEALGHHGFRSLMPPMRLNSLMDQMYKRYDEIKLYVAEAVVAETGQTLESLPKYKQDSLRREFTEEYLADMAAVMDTNMLARVWSALKTAIEKITGVQFNDHMARYFVGQARKYVRNGKVDARLLNWEDMGRNILQAETGTDNYNMAAYNRGIENLYAAGQAAGTAQNVIGLPVSIQKAGEHLRRYGINTRGAFEVAAEQLFSLRTYRFRENRGAELVFDAITRGKNTAMRIINETNEIMRPALDLMAFDRFAGVITKPEYDKANKLIYDAMFYSINQYKASKMGKTPLVLFDEETGTVKVNDDEVKRLRGLGEVSVEQFRKGIKYEVEVQDSPDGATYMSPREIKPRPDLTTDSAEWKAYQAARQAVAHIWTQKLIADYQGFLQERDLNFRRIAERMDGDVLTVKDRNLLQRLTEIVYELQTANMVVDEETGAVQYNAEDVVAKDKFVENINRALLGVEGADKEASAYDALKKTLGDTAATGPLLGDLRDMARRLRLSKGDGGSSNQQKFVVQDALKQIIMHELRKSDSERLAKQSIAQGYAPLKRRGKYQMRVLARNEKGQIVRLDDDHKAMLAFRMFDTEADSLSTTDLVNRTLFNNPDGTPVKFEGVRAYDDAKDAEGFRPMTITLEAVAENTLAEQAAPPHLNINEFMAGLSRFNIVLAPKKMNEVIVAMTKQNNAARKRLQREGAPGFHPDAIRAVSEFAESMGSNIAKALMRPQISEYMDLTMRSSQKLWFGDEGYLQELKQNWEKLSKDPNANEKMVEVAKRKYRKYAFQMAKTNPPGGLRRGNMYKNEAASLLAFLDGNANFQESSFESGKIVSQLRAYTSIFQLGASIATGALNYIGAIMNGIPTLATYNEERAFGGGFGFARSTKEFFTAMHQIGMSAAIANKRLNEGDFYNEMVGDSNEAVALREKYGLTKDEAVFLRDEIREGVMKPAQSIAVLGTARGRMEKAATRKAVDTIMWVFNQTEQGSRRSLGLAAYRMERDRQMAGRTDPNSVSQERDAIEAARRFAVETLDQTVGRYDVSNRPPVFRGGVLSLAYMYKVFPTTSIHMLRNLDRSGKLAFLTGMFLLSGIRGLPFAEDIEDMIDTIAQMLGMQWRGTRIEMAEQVDKIFPGFSPQFIRGVMNTFSVGDIGIRTQLGDFIPGTGMFLAGANTFREASDVAGPMFGMLNALVKTVPNFFRATTALATGNPRVTFNDVARESPITMLRAFGDALAYHRSGAIVDRRGYVVSPDLHAGHLALRMLGWYPAAAANQYDVIRSTQRMTNYQRDVAASYRIAWIKATLQGDTERARRVEQEVAEWNRAAKGTGLELSRTFRSDSRRALREAQRSAVERARRTAPVNARDDVDLTIRLLGYN